MIKRFIDLVTSAVLLVVLSPALAVIAIVIWMQDRRSPLYIAARVGRRGDPFQMVKFRSMVVGADRTGVASTGASDSRLTPIGKAVRRYKADELPQLWNVLKGDMSLVGPRPNVPAEVALYTPEERRILTVRPGVTDLASIVFSDEAQILANSDDPDLDYNRLIRPWKSRLALYYVDHQSLRLDLATVALTLVSMIDRQRALKRIERLLADAGADEELRITAVRRGPLREWPPPGAAAPVRSR